MGNGFFETTNGGALTTAGKAIIGLDLNGDGIDDAVYAAGDVTVVYGDAGGFVPVVDLDTLAPTAGFTLTGPTLGDEFGYVVAKATDLQNTGTDALLIGAPGSGVVSVVFTGQTSVGFTVTGLPSQANGMSLAGLGDINDDGIGDFAIGAPDAYTENGAVYVVYGSATLGGTIDVSDDVSDLDGTNGFIIDGFGDGDRAGTSIAGGFDFNGDGFNDLLIGAPGYENGIGGGDAGAVYVVYGSDASTDGTVALADLTTTMFTGLAAGDALGTTVSAGGDINNDGIDDIIISAPLANDDRSGATYVVFGSDGSEGTVPLAADLSSLNGSNGFAINGISVASVEMLGDVSGDGIDDLGIVSTAGDVYIVFGLDTPGLTADFLATVDVTTLDGTDGIALTGLFSDTPTSVSIAALGDVNSDPSGPIGDIGIIATYEGGTPTQSFTVLGGTANFAALDTADGGKTGTINFAGITAPVDFVETDPTIELTGIKAATINEDAESVSGAISIRDTTSQTSPTFVGSSAVYGLYGMFAIDADGNEWTYTVDIDPTNLEFLNSLDAGDVIFDSATLVADNGTQREITITINGLDDPAILSFVLDGPATEDTGRFSGLITLTDPDEDDSPAPVAATVVGAHGSIQVAADGTFTYFLTDASLQNLDAGDPPATDTFSLLADDGVSYNITLSIAGANEGIPPTYSDNPNVPDTIYTSFGNDIINARRGDDFINSGGGNDTVDAGAGNDTVFDPLGNDDVTGGEGNDDIRLLSGNNAVDAGIGNDKIVTGFGYDTIDAGAGNDVIAADHGSIFTFGNNRITGGDGDDYMMGGMGVDVFVFDADDGNDTIGAFDPDAVTAILDGYDVFSTGRSFQVGVDKIELIGFLEADLQTNVMAYVDLLDGGSQFSAGTTVITLVNVFDLTETDFIFV